MQVIIHSFIKLVFVSLLLCRARHCARIGDLKMDKMPLLLRDLETKGAGRQVSHQSKTVIRAVIRAQIGEP